MKKFTFLILVVVAGLCLSFINHSLKFHPEGTWKATDTSGHVNRIEFLPDGKLRFKGEKNNVLPNDVAFRYKFNFDKKPVWCDIIIYSFSGDKIGLMEGIADIKSKNNFTLKISKESRPKSFESKVGETLEFVRIN